MSTDEESKKPDGSESESAEHSSEEAPAEGNGDHFFSPIRPTCL
jgi:hypothetical protein